MNSGQLEIILKQGKKVFIMFYDFTCQRSLVYSFTAQLDVFIIMKFYNQLFMEF